MGKLDLNLGDLGADAITISGHKFGSVSGVGAVLINANRPISSLLFGGPQEGRHRGGTENIVGIKSMGLAAHLARRDLSKRIQGMRERIEIIETIISREIPGVEKVRAMADRLPNTLCVRVPGVRSDDLVVSADLGGVAISAGSACSSGKQLPSHVLMALGLSESEARECVRLSVCGETPIDLVSSAAVNLSSIIKRRMKS
jgi:cysteine desulfurase